MSNNLQCPMTFTKRSYNVEGDHCKEHKCAWWVPWSGAEIRGACAVTSLAVTLEGIACMMLEDKNNE